MMRIGYVIGALGRGGAELQLMRLAEGLTQRGHHVHVLAYDDASSFDDDLRRASVRVTVGRRPRSRLTKLRTVRQWLSTNEFDVVHAILERAASLTVVARQPRRKPPVVVTDISTATYPTSTVLQWTTLLTYAGADRVVTENDVNRANLERLAPWLRGKVRLVRNGLDLDRFAPAVDGARLGEAEATFVFCVVGTLYAPKNPFGVIDAVAELEHRGHTNFRVDWYGRLGLGGDTPEVERIIAYANERHVADRLVFHGDVSDIAQVYRKSDALLHVALREGFPNAVTEGTASGLPMVVSDVSDLPLLIEEAENGYLVDATDPVSIANGMERMLSTPRATRADMGRRSRELAMRWFAMQRYIDDYEALYAELNDAARSRANRSRQ